jgi:hypothetical protein
MTPDPVPPDGPAPVRLDASALDQAVRVGIARYVAARRPLVKPFVDRHFSWRGSLALHRHALGWDLFRAPANLALGLPHSLVQLTGAGASRLGARRFGQALRRRSLLLPTAVAQEIERLIQAELLQLPGPDGGEDALAQEILRDPGVETALVALLGPVGARAEDARFRLRLEATLARYAASRPAAAELSVALVAVGTGALAFEKLTPGALTLGPVLAGSLAQSAAIAGFPLGASLGALWYGAFPVTAPWALTAGVTGGLMAGAAIFAGFAGLVADPMQRRLGLHERRLHRLLDALERQWQAPDGPGLTLRDHYVARLVDLFDLAAAAWRVAQ